MFGPDVLVSPVTEPNVTAWRVYLPEGSRWEESYTGKLYDGGQVVEAEAPLAVIPVFVREGCGLDIYGELLKKS